MGGVPAAIALETGRATAPVTANITATAANQERPNDTDAPVTSECLITAPEAGSMREAEVRIPPWAGTCVGP